MGVIRGYEEYADTVYVVDHKALEIEGGPLYALSIADGSRLSDT